jgi:hypothetical protein
MPEDLEHIGEHTHLLPASANDRRLSRVNGGDAASILSSHISKEEQALSNTAIGVSFFDASQNHHLIDSRKG